MEKLESRISQVLGDVSRHLSKLNRIEFSIENEFEFQGVCIKEILISVDKDKEVPAFVLSPKSRRDKINQGILALHQTTDEKFVGAQEVAGLNGNENYFYGLELAKYGFTVIAPDYPFFGKYQTTTIEIYKDFAYQSVSLKAVINNMAAIQVLGALEEISLRSVFCIGHSLGGTNALFTSFFEPRISSLVISAGFTTFEQYALNAPGRNLEKWSQKDKYMPNIKNYYGNDFNKIPFDFPELLFSVFPKPIFISHPQNDEIFPFQGALACIQPLEKLYYQNNLHESICLSFPNSKHDFPKDVRVRAMEFLLKQTKVNQNG